jgi:hypothetical protein
MFPYRIVSVTPAAAGTINRLRDIAYDSGSVEPGRHRVLQVNQF